jgi:hypothetical protein
MSSSSLIHLAGLAAISSSVLSVIGDLLSLLVDLENPVSATTSSYTIVFFLYLLGGALLLPSTRFVGF